MKNISYKKRKADMMTARWQGTIAFLLLIIISYVDRVNISVTILNPEFGNAVNLLMTILICSHSILVTSG
ncbi:hypothetical protein DJ481_06275 [Enterobacter hormaechei]|nr:hypothetical protein B9Q36_17070 [Enterobacter hormaechei]POU06405.1 hypothetical protein C3376_08835 [Enterobacter cloacae complex sp. ECNIH17]TYF24549.1 hypothetical protein DJ481_06275 [Enterobacter hormaechei]